MQLNSHCMQVGASLLNVVLDPLLMFRARLGLGGGGVFYTQLDNTSDTYFFSAASRLSGLRSGWNCMARLRYAAFISAAEQP